MTDETPMTEEDVRAILLRYMHTAGIGDTVLAEEMKKAFPNETQFPVRTLRRFLDGGIHTNDRTVEICREFAVRIKSS